jgi:hypothetical protein
LLATIPSFVEELLRLSTAASQESRLGIGFGKYFHAAACCTWAGLQYVRDSYQVIAPSWSLERPE